MTTKFEQLLDLIVNEEMDKANELFHEIVVEKSRSIYENLIAQEAQDEEMDESSEEEEMDESAEEDDEELDESSEEEMDESADEEMDESEVELEDSYSMEADDEVEPSGDEEADDLGGDVEMPGDDMGDEGPEASEDEAMMDIKNAIAELEAAFAELESSKGDDMGSEMDDEFGDMPKAEDESEMMGMYEGKKRMTREYVEKVGNDWESKSSMKAQAKYVAAGSGDTEGSPVEGRSPIASGKNKPGPAGVNAKNLVQGASESAPDGTSPNGKAGGFLSNPKDMNTGNGNVPGGKMGVKNLKKVPAGHGAEKKGGSPGPVGSGTGEKAGQTSVNPVKQFLKPYTK